MISGEITPGICHPRSAEQTPTIFFSLVCQENLSLETSAITVLDYHWLPQDSECLLQSKAGEVI